MKKALLSILMLAPVAVACAGKDSNELQCPSSYGELGFDVSKLSTSTSEDGAMIEKSEVCYKANSIKPKYNKIVYVSTKRMSSSEVLLVFRLDGVTNLRIVYRFVNGHGPVSAYRTTQPFMKIVK